MALNSADIGELSRLFDQGLALPVDERSDWLARLPAPLAHLARPLQEMLDQSGPDAQGGLLSTLPKLDACDLGPRAGDHVGPYRILGPVGQGGMSTVCLAEKSDGELRRLVALKMPRLTLSSASQIERFQRERDVLALLNHPQVARLYDAGVAANGRPFVVLEHVVGKPITEACDALGLGIEGRVRMFLELLSAVEHAHLNLPVHRDIEPSNVFVDAQGHVKLLDFGIAKLLDSGAGPCSATRLTQEAGAAYTPTCAAPEQVGGKPVSLATDIYSLGVLLYELLTGSAPDAQAQDSVVNSIFAKLKSEPPWPAVARPGPARPALRAP
jgi:serine/threonine-protein kinase